MIVLGLDLATLTGWALYKDSQISSGVWSLRPGVGNLHRTRWLNIWGHLLNAYRDHKFTRVVCERPIAAGRGFADAGWNFGLAAMAEAFCESHQIPLPEYVAPGRLKKHATGNGRASKQDMVAAAQARWPEMIIHNHNQADALWVLDWGLTNGKGKHAETVERPEVEF